MHGIHSSLRRAEGLRPSKCSPSWHAKPFQKCGRKKASVLTVAWDRSLPQILHTKLWKLILTRPKGQELTHHLPAALPAAIVMVAGGWRSVAAASPVEPHKPSPPQPQTATTGASPTPPVLHPLSPQSLPYLRTWQILLQGRGARTVVR